jgi:hypothetical protein
MLEHQTGVAQGAKKGPMCRSGIGAANLQSDPMKWYDSSQPWDRGTRAISSFEL